MEGTAAARATAARSARHGGTSRPAPRAAPRPDRPACSVRSRTGTSSWPTVGARCRPLARPVPARGPVARRRRAPFGRASSKRARFSRPATRIAASAEIVAGTPPDRDRVAGTSTGARATEATRDPTGGTARRIVRFPTAPRTRRCRTRSPDPFLPLAGAKAGNARPPGMPPTARMVIGIALVLACGLRAWGAPGDDGARVDLLPALARSDVCPGADSTSRACPPSSGRRSTTSWAAHASSSTGRCRTPVSNRTSRARRRSSSAMRARGCRSSGRCPRRVHGSIRSSSPGCGRSATRAIDGRNPAAPARPRSRARR